MKLDYSVSPDELLVQRTKTRDPNVSVVYEAKLKDGPQAFRFAFIYKIVNPRTGDLHHYALKIENWKRTKTRGWEEQPERSISLDQEEFEKLVDFIESVVGERLPGEEREYVVVRGREFGRVRDLVRMLPKLETEAKLEFVREVLRGVADDAFDSSELMEGVVGDSRSVLQEIAAAANLVQYRQAYDDLQALIEDPAAREKQFQRLLQDNPWMFGSEYSELLDRRTWTRDERQDFMLRRTVDGYLEIAEIKTPSVPPLFNWDASHKSYYPSAPLSLVVGQVINYIEQVDRDRNSIMLKDQVDPLKIRARVIIGRDGDAEQQQALRNLNGHLHRIEVLTFDQLSRIAQRVLDVFRSEAAGNAVDEDDDLPF